MIYFFSYFVAVKQEESQPPQALPHPVLQPPQPLPCLRFICIDQTAKTTAIKIKKPNNQLIIVVPLYLIKFFRQPDTTVIARLRKAKSWQSPNYEERTLSFSGSLKSFLHCRFLIGAFLTSLRSLNAVS
ncbi:MAG: hypothetical protein IK065_01485 [Neisseriaceae bacterium]|nr:hypothetical protein [Neisseriaceae bacterium]